MFKVGLVTVSDKGAQGERRDASGMVLAKMVQAQGWQVITTRIVSDDLEAIIGVLTELCDLGLDLVLTTGGTGMSPRDNTPEATTAVIERPMPGFPEAMRHQTARITPRAYLSRGVAGIRGQTLIVNLPGSPKGARECLEVILPILPHGLQILAGTAGECGREGD